MRIAVAGGTGTVGRYVVAHAEQAGHEVVVLRERCSASAPEQGVRHIVTLSIVGIDKTSFGRYAAKLEHERAVASVWSWPGRGPGCCPTGGSAGMAGRG